MPAEGVCRCSVVSRKNGHIGRSRGVGSAHTDPLPVGVPLSFILVERPREHVALVTLNRPERMNAMAFDVMLPFREALDAISNDTSVRAVVITGAGRGFCSGADQRSAGPIPHIEADPTDDRAPLDGVARRRHPDAAPHAPAGDRGGQRRGDRRRTVPVAGRRHPARRSRGLLPRGRDQQRPHGERLGLSYLLPRAIGSSRAFEIMLTGRDVDADEAARIGLVSRVVAQEDLLEEAFDMAQRIAMFSRPASNSPSAPCGRASTRRRWRST